MSLSLGTLTAYVEQNATGLVMRSVLEGKTAQIVKAAGGIQTGIKSSETINIMDSDAVFQANSGCGFNASGTTSVTQRTITVGKIKVEESVCPQALEAYFTQKALSAGSHYDTFAFAKEWTDIKVAKTNKALETAYWMGDTGSGTANLNKFDGFKKIIDAGSGVVDANPDETTTITASNIVSILDDVFEAIPSDIVDADDLRIFLGPDLFRMYVLKLRDLNLFHYAAADNGNGSLIYPGTNIRIESVYGLNASDSIYAMRASNMRIGTDLLDEQDKFKVFYDESDDVVKYSNKFKAGVQVAFLDEIVKWVKASA